MPEAFLKLSQTDRNEALEVAAALLNFSVNMRICFSLVK